MNQKNITKGILLSNDESNFSIRIPEDFHRNLSGIEVKSPITAIISYNINGGRANGTILALLCNGNEVATIDYNDSDGFQQKILDLTPSLNAGDNTIRVVSIVSQIVDTSAHLTLIEDGSKVFVDINWGKPSQIVQKIDVTYNISLS